MTPHIVFTAGDIVGLFLLSIGCGVIGLVYLYVWAVQAYLGVRRWWRKRGDK